MDDRVQAPPESIDRVGEVIATASGYDSEVISRLQVGTRFDVRLQEGDYVTVTPGFSPGDPEHYGLMGEAYRVQGVLRTDADGKPVLIPSIDGKRVHPLYDLITIKSTLDFPHRFEVERGGERGGMGLYGFNTSEARKIPGGNPRLVLYISDPGTWVSILSPSAPWDGSFRVAAERTDLLDRVGKPIYRELSLTLLPPKEVYQRK